MNDPNVFSFSHDGYAPTEDKPVAVLVPTRPEADVAKELKSRMDAKLREACAIMDEAAAAGLEIGFQIGMRGDGRRIVTALTCTKHF